MNRWLGIDFSGNHLKWRAGCSTSNVWIADVRRDERGLHVHDVRRVQGLPGSGDPFDRLAAVLVRGDYDAAGIDAPFSVPDEFVRRVGGHAPLVKLVGSRSAAGRPFIDGRDLVRIVAGQAPPLTPPKPLRETDAYWRDQGVNIRSPMWTGARPGAPMTAACLTLLHRAARPMWPWALAGSGVLVEAFPAGQLKTWGLPRISYDGSSAGATAVRTTILDGISGRVRVGPWKSTLLGSADALDAVLCSFAAVTARTASPPRSALAATEGSVLVHP